MVRVRILESDAQVGIWPRAESDSNLGSDSKSYGLRCVVEIPCASISLFENGDDGSNTGHLKNYLRN